MFTCSPIYSTATKNCFYVILLHSRYNDSLYYEYRVTANDKDSQSSKRKTEEAEPSLTIETETEFISKEKAIAGLNTAREYFMNSKEDCRNEINSSRSFVVARVHCSVKKLSPAFLHDSLKLEFFGTSFNKSSLIKNIEN
ncbi:hypothetical protein BpHYR1_001014 [Brachionus plicatilis]|uniref:Uncharacterized protein n=1 Tax=Brachionus plicatilis TaxID=10195 RepID=A0A3M7SU27_BRAPC|nr:hypothetical protein BpHYR1_001014 [Brachionus plicatilis]